MYNTSSIAAELDFFLTKADNVNQDVTTTGESDSPLAKDTGLAATDCALVDDIVAADSGGSPFIYRSVIHVLVHWCACLVPNLSLSLSLSLFLYM